MLCDRTMGRRAIAAIRKRPARIAEGGHPGSQRMKMPAVAQVAVERRAIAIPPLSSLASIIVHREGIKAYGGVDNISQEKSSYFGLAVYQ